MQYYWWRHPSLNAEYSTYSHSENPATFLLKPAVFLLEHVICLKESQNSQNMNNFAREVHGCLWVGICWQCLEKGAPITHPAIPPFRDSWFLNWNMQVFYQNLAACSFIFSWGNRTCFKTVQNRIKRLILVPGLCRPWRVWRKLLTLNPPCSCLQVIPTTKPVHHVQNKMQHVLKPLCFSKKHHTKPIAQMHRSWINMRTA